MKFYESLGRRIFRLRTQRRWTQEQFGEKLGVSAQSVSKWERGVTSPDISLILPIAAEFQITADELLGAERSAKAPCPAAEKQEEDLTVQIQIRDRDGEDVFIRIPYPLFAAPEELPAITRPGGEVRLVKVSERVDKGLRGKILEWDEDGDTVTITVNANPRS